MLLQNNKGVNYTFEGVKVYSKYLNLIPNSNHDVFLSSSYQADFLPFCEYVVAISQTLNFW